MRRAAFTAALALLACAAPADAAVDDTVLVTRAGLDGPVADRSSQAPSISADGRIVTFDTEATNLGAGPGLYAKDMVTGTLQRLDTAAGRPPTQQARVADSGAFACFVANGRIHVREIGGGMALRDGGAAILAYEAQNNNDFDSTFKNCDVSDDGNRVAYSTMSSHDPLDGDPAGRSAADVYVHDFPTGNDILVSRMDGVAGDDGDDYSVAPEITPDGRFVLFRSRADNLSAENDDAVSDLYVRDLVAGRTTWVSRADGPAGGPGAQPGNPVNGTSGSAAAAMSNDARFVAFQTFMRGLDPASIGTGSAQVMVRDLVAGTTRNAAVSRDPAGNRIVLNGNNNNPTINADGTLVGFGGANSGIDPTVTVQPNTEEEFLRGTVADRTSLITRESGVLGNAADAQSYAAQVAAGGGAIVFASEATNLSAEDVDGIGDGFATTGNFTHNVRDVFVRVLDPRRPLVADVPGAPAVGTTELLAALPPVLTPIQGFAIPADVETLLTASPAARPAATAVAAQRTRRPMPKAVRVQLGEYGIVTLALERVRPGRRVRGTCRPAARRPKLRKRRCTRFVRMAATARAGYEGTNVFTFDWALAGRASLARGEYRLRIVEYDLGRRIGERRRRFSVR